MKSDYTPGPSACGSCTGFLVSHHAIVCISIGWSFGESKNSLLLASFNLLMMQRQTETDEIRLRVLDRQRYTFNGFFCGLSIGTHSLWWQPSANDMFWLLSILHTFESPFLFRHLAPHILNIFLKETQALYETSMGKSEKRFRRCTAPVPFVWLPNYPCLLHQTFWMNFDSGKEITSGAIHSHVWQWHIIRNNLRSDNLQLGGKIELTRIDFEFPYRT